MSIDKEGPPGAPAERRPTEAAAAKSPTEAQPHAQPVPHMPQGQGTGIPPTAGAFASPLILFFQPYCCFPLAIAFTMVTHITLFLSQQVLSMLALLIFSVFFWILLLIWPPGEQMGKAYGCLFLNI